MGKRESLGNGSKKTVVFFAIVLVGISLYVPYKEKLLLLPLDISPISYASQYRPLFAPPLPWREQQVSKDPTKRPFMVAGAQIDLSRWAVEYITALTIMGVLLWVYRSPERNGGTKGGEGE